MRRRVAVLTAILLALVLGVELRLQPTSAQESFSGWRGDPIKRGSGFRFANGSARVREVQRHLRALGYTISQEDGRFGPLTERAVREFQRRNGLRPTGIVAVATIRELRAATEARAPARRKADGATGGGSGAGGATGTEGGGAPAAEPTEEASGQTPAAGRTTPVKPAPAVEEPPAQTGAPAEERAARTPGGAPAGTEPPRSSGWLILAGATVVLVAALGAAVLGPRRGRSQETGAASREPLALSERIAKMRASGLSPQAVSEQIAAERRAVEGRAPEGLGRRD
jgi:peptidoglycan hydrolase-like protein with peptidoglycan-binding domain